eukprot:8665514-Pyramimonas_sp.AAC.1
MGSLDELEALADKLQMRAQAWAISKGQQKFLTWVREAWVSKLGQLHRHVTDKAVDAQVVQGMANPIDIMRSRQQCGQQ